MRVDGFHANFNTVSIYYARPFSQSTKRSLVEFLLTKLLHVAAVKEREMGRLLDAFSPRKPGTDRDNHSFGFLKMSELAVMFYLIPADSTQPASLKVFRFIAGKVREELLELAFPPAPAVRASAVKATGHGQSSWLDNLRAQYSESVNEELLRINDEVPIHEA